MTQKSNKRLSPADRKQQLLEVAVQIFAEKGIGEARHADIAKTASVSVATTFVYFPTREALVDHVLAYLEDYLIKLLDWSPFVDQPLPVILESLARRALERAKTHPYHIKLMLAWSAHFGEAIRPKYLAFLDKELDRMTLLLRQAATVGAAQDQNPLDKEGDDRDGDDRDGARLLNGVIYVMMQMALDDEPPEKIKRFTARSIQMIVASQPQG